MKQILIKFISNINKRHFRNIKKNITKKENTNPALKLLTSSSGVYNTTLQKPIFSFNMGIVSRIYDPKQPNQISLEKQNLLCFSNQINSFPSTIYPRILYFNALKHKNNIIYDNWLTEKIITQIENKHVTHQYTIENGIPLISAIKYLRSIIIPYCAAIKLISHANNSIASNKDTDSFILTELQKLLYSNKTISEYLIYYYLSDINKTTFLNTLLFVNNFDTTLRHLPHFIKMHGSISSINNYRKKILKDNDANLKSLVLRTRLDTDLHRNKLISEVIKSILRSLYKYIPIYGAKYQTYLLWWVMGKVKKVLTDLKPKYLTRNSKRVKSLKTKIKKISLQIGRLPTIREIAAYCKIPAEVVVSILESQKSGYSQISLYNAISNFGDPNKVIADNLKHEDRPTYYSGARVKKNKKKAKKISINSIPADEKTRLLIFSLKYNKVPYLTHQTKILKTIFNLKPDKLRQLTKVTQRAYSSSG